METQPLGWAARGGSRLFQSKRFSDVRASQMSEPLPFTMCCDGEHFLRASPGLDPLPHRQAISAEHD